MERGEFAIAPFLFDPLDAQADAWPTGSETIRSYIEEIARAGVTDMIENVRTELRVLRSDDHVYPVTINEGESGDSYVCLPHSAYILYGQQELDLVDTGLFESLFRWIIKRADRLLLKAEINKIVHVDNWMLSTNLHGDWDGSDIGPIREMLVEKFPYHILAIRSVDAWSCPGLLEATKRDGWADIPSRQIWVTDDMNGVWRRKNSTNNDRRLLQKSTLKIEDIHELRAGDADRISALYHMLYVGKYSPLNPVFTPTYIEMTLKSGIFSYRGARDENGQLMAVAGFFVRGGILTPPVVGYDTSRPQKEGLYRIACYLFSEFAAEQGLRLNGSAGASQFKKYRGATNVIEYSMMYIDHLSFKRRAVLKLLRFILKHFAVPMMKRKEL